MVDYHSNMPSFVLSLVDVSSFPILITFDVTLHYCFLVDSTIEVHFLFPLPNLTTVSSMMIDSYHSMTNVVVVLMQPLPHPIPPRSLFVPYTPYLHVDSVYYLLVGLYNIVHPRHSVHSQLWPICNYKDLVFVHPVMMPIHEAQDSRIYLTSSSVVAVAVAVDRKR